MKHKETNPHNNSSQGRLPPPVSPPPEVPQTAHIKSLDAPAVEIGFEDWEIEMHLNSPPPRY